MNGENITFESVRSSFTKREVMFPVFLAFCFMLKIFQCSEHYAPKVRSKKRIIVIARIQLKQIYLLLINRMVIIMIVF